MLNPTCDINQEVREPIFYYNLADIWLYATPDILELMKNLVSAQTEEEKCMLACSWRITV